MLTRRQSLYLITSTAATFLGSRLTIYGGGASPGLLTPEQEEGPFYIPDEHIRMDVSEGKPGVPLVLSIALIDSTTGKPVAGAAVDIWHCDAGGTYSGFTKMPHMGPPPGQAGPPGDFHGGDDHPMGPPPDGDFGGPDHDHDHGPGADGGPGGHGWQGGPPHMKPTDASTFLRGVQITDEKGEVTFSTVYPGWYPGREIHVHLKVHLAGAAQQSIYSGGHVCHTGQIFFPDATNYAVSRMSPYIKSDIPRTTKKTDHVYLDQHGDRCVATMSGSTAGYAAVITLAIDPSAPPKGRPA